MSDSVADLYDQTIGSYLLKDILAPESQFLSELKQEWYKVRFLDLGVGAGRTTWTFSRIVDRYVGVDIAPEMVEQCRKLFGENSQRKFVVGNAMDLSQFATGSFDAVLFSYNGIDHLNAEERTRCLHEVFRVLKAGGRFLFSSHHLGVFPHSPWTAWQPGTNPVRWPKLVPGLLKEWLFFREVNRIATSPEAQERGWAVLPDVAHSYSLNLVYIRPEAQLAELEKVGFRLDRLMDTGGNDADLASLPTHQWYFHYLCRKPEQG